MSAKRNDLTPEVHSARSKLDGVLQTLVDKKDESPEVDIDSIVNSLTPEVRLHRIKIETPECSPSKKTPKSSSKKRKRGKDDDYNADIGHFHHTYVMKLFDRSVDLAQFEEEAPLYPVCRAWIRNQPHNRDLIPRDRTPTPPPIISDDSEEESKIKDVYKLPRPVVIKEEATGNPVDLRVPSPGPQSGDPLDIHEDPDKVIAPEQLLLDHMHRWKVIREKWRNQSQINEARYSESLNTLKEIFDAQLNKDG